MLQSPAQFEQSLLRRAFLGIGSVYLSLLVVSISGQLLLLVEDGQLGAVLVCRVLSLVVVASALVWAAFEPRLPEWVPPTTFGIATVLAIYVDLGLGGNRTLSMAVYLFDGLEYLLILGLFLRRRWVTLASGAFLMVLGVVAFGVLPGDQWFPLVLRIDEIQSGLFSLIVFGLSVTTGIVFINDDIYRRIAGRVLDSFERLQVVAYQDSATGLPNGLQLEQDILTWEQQPKLTVGKLVMLGFRLDGLERLNETLGVEATTRLVTEVISGYAEEVDANRASFLGMGQPKPFRGLYRVESNLFVFVVTTPPGATTDFGNLHILEGVIQRALARRSPGLYLSFQGGFTFYPDDADGLSQLLRNLLNLLHASRFEVQGRFVPFSRDKYKEHQRREALRLSLQQALEARSLRLVFQPKFEAATRRVLGFEALARWTTPAGVPIPPSEFIPLAEQSDLIVTLTRQVVDEACVFLRLLETEGLPRLPVAVNLSPGVLQTEFLDSLIDHLTQMGLGDRFQLEITESSAMRLSEALQDRLHRLRALGVTFAIDDFGTGYSNLAYLQDLDADVLKIDKRFIDEVASDERTSTLVSILVQMAHAFDMRVVAEGVENQAQWDHLSRLLVDEIQGFHGSPPLDAGEAVGWAQRSLGLPPH